VLASRDRERETPGHATRRPTTATGRGTCDRGDTITHLGAIAQLGERRHGMAEVEGSSPSSSIADKTEGLRPTSVLLLRDLKEFSAIEERANVARRQAGDIGHLPGGQLLVCRVSLPAGPSLG
jgi:hypothetical protein